MKPGPAFLVAFLAAFPANTASSNALPASYHSLASDFQTFFDRSATMPKAARIAAFEKQFDVLFPGFYKPMVDETQAQFDDKVSRALDGFPALRSRYEQVERTFPQALVTTMTVFRKRFPGFPPPVPIWFVHSLGRMDGGTRTIDGQTYMIFGADVIARLHDRSSTGPFLDHELFHVENSRWFKDCEPDTTIWCSLWQEGTAVYNASSMNPGATDQMLTLDTPRPIRAEVDANWHRAICQTLQDLEKTDEETYANYFLNDGQPHLLPRRWGYYVAYRMVQRLDPRYSIQQMDHFDHAAVHRIVTMELKSMAKDAGGCR